MRILETRDFPATQATAEAALKFLQTYSAVHWFCESDRPDHYDGQAAALAWERTFAFLKMPDNYYPNRTR